MGGTLAFLVGALAYCSFGPDEYTGAEPDPAPVDDGGGPTDDGGGSTDDGGGATDGRSGG